MKKHLGLFAVSSALFLGAVAQAQPPGSMAPGAAGGPPGASVTTTTSTSTDAPPAFNDIPESGTMPTTGGAPIAMALSGVLTAAGAFFVRRKLS